jgi:hopanoid biosynthesis associated radical SAM protein HpnH
MSVPLIQQWRVGSYIMKQRFSGRARYPLVLMLEPLFRCNLACPGCGKIDYSEEILNKRLSLAECLQAVDECGAPVVSIPGGEPLLHKEIEQIVAGIIERKKFVYLCTNALLLEKRIDRFTPTPYLTFSVHLDGSKEEHDKAVGQEGVFERAVSAIRLARAKGFRTNINCTLYEGHDVAKLADFISYACDDLGVEGVTVSPGFSYEHAASQDKFLKRDGTQALFRKLFDLGKGRKWRFSQSTLFLDFLAGNQNYACTPWGTPTRNVFGWQKPCYLLADGFAQSFQELMDSTDWDKYGTGHDPRCADCMMHCGYEASAVADTVAHPLKALGVFIKGPGLAS